jgi:hypothetical protein
MPSASRRCGRRALARLDAGVERQGAPPPRTGAVEEGEAAGRDRRSTNPSAAGDAEAALDREAAP